MGGRGASANTAINSGTITNGQEQFERRIRTGTAEEGAFFDENGNMLLASTGDMDAVEFDPYEMNHKVERRIWNGEKVFFTHNHPQNTIFSPEDVETFEMLENHSLRAVLPNGTNYTLIREQPITSNEWVYDESAGEYRRTFEPKQIGPAYREEYSRLYDNRYRATRALTGQERQTEIERLDRDVANGMTKWLKANAKKYGYRFIKDVT